MSGDNIVNVHTILLSYHELGLPHIPERHSIVQVRKYIRYVGPRIAIFQPTLLDDSPQPISEPEAFRILRFLRSIPLSDRVNDENIRLNINIGMMSTQHLGGYQQSAVNRS